MERGTVRTYDKSCGVGTIARKDDNDIRFYAESIITRDRALLTMGDTVLFESSNLKNMHIAINIRKIEIAF